MGSAYILGLQGMPALGNGHWGYSAAGWIAVLLPSPGDKSGVDDLHTGEANNLIQHIDTDQLRFKNFKLSLYISIHFQVSDMNECI